MTDQHSSLEDSLLERGEVRHLSGNNPLELISDQSGLWVVLEGTVDVFSVFQQKADDIYERKHVFRQVRGEGLLPIAPEHPPEGLELRAIGKPGTRVVFVDHDGLQALLDSDGYGNRLSEVIDSWLCGWAEAIIHQQPPRQFTELQAGSTLEIAPGSPLHPLENVVWVRSAEAGEFIDRPELEIPASDCLFPVPPPAWLTFGAQCEVETFSTTNALQNHYRKDMFASFHSLVLRARRDNLLEDREQEKQRRDEKRARDHAENKHTLRKLASILHPDMEAPHVHAEVGLHPIVEVCSVLDEALNMDLGLPGDTEELFDEGREAPIDVLSRQSSFRTRRVRLEGRWWLTDSGPSIAYKKDNNAPVALIPGGDETYTLYDPETQSYVSVDEQVAEELKTTASMIYPSLPDKELDGWDLLKFSARGLQKQFFLLLLMGAAGGLLGLLTPIITGVLFDQIIPGAERGRLLVFIAGLFIAAFAGMLFDLTRNFALLSAEGKMQGRLQPAIWDRVLNMPMPFFARYKVGDLAQRAGGIMAIRQALSGATITTIISGVFSIFSFFLLFYYSPTLALLASGLTVVAIILLAVFSYFKIKYNREIAELGGELSSRVLELIHESQRFGLPVPNGVRSLAGRTSSPRKDNTAIVPVK